MLTNYAVENQIAQIFKNVDLPKLRKQLLATHREPFQSSVDLHTNTLGNKESMCLHLLCGRQRTTETL